MTGRCALSRVVAVITVLGVCFGLSNRFVATPPIVPVQLRASPRSPLRPRPRSLGLRPRSSGRRLPAHAHLDAVHSSMGAPIEGPCVGEPDVPRPEGLDLGRRRKPSSVYFHAQRGRRSTNRRPMDRSVLRIPDGQGSAGRVSALQLQVRSRTSSNSSLHLLPEIGTNARPVRARRGAGRARPQTEVLGAAQYLARRLQPAASRPPSRLVCEVPCISAHGILGSASACYDVPGLIGTTRGLRICHRLAWLVSFRARPRSSPSRRCRRTPNDTQSWHAKPGVAFGPAAPGLRCSRWPNAWMALAARHSASRAW